MLGCQPLYGLNLSDKQPLVKDGMNVGMGGGAMALSTAERVLQSLLPFDPREEGNGKYRLNSPFRPGSNSHAFTLVIDDGEHGAYHDFVSDESGSLYELAQRLGIDISRTTVENSKRVYQGLSDYAAAKGVPREAFLQAGWKEVEHKGRRALAFSTLTGTRYRYLDGATPHYESRRGYRRCWYGLERAFATYNANIPLVLCNGEASTVAAQYHRIPAFCLTGGEAKIPAALLQELVAKLWLPPSETTILIALDCDKTGRQAALAIKQQLSEHGFSSVRAVDLMLSDKGDLADFCNLHREQALPALLSLPSLQEDSIVDAQEDDEESFTIYDVTELDRLPKLEWLLRGVVPKNGMMMLFGESNVGKSFWALCIALLIALEYLVLYVALEGEAGIAKRIYGWCKHHGKTLDQLNFKLMTGYVDLFDSAGMTKFLGAVAPLKPRLIVIDTLGLVTGAGDENSARDMNLVIRACQRIRRETGCTLLFVHHTRKNDGRERGSGALRGRMDVMIKVSPHDDLIAIECSKTRDEKPFPTEYVKLLPVTVEGLGDTLVPVPASQIVRSENDPLTPDQRRLLEVMALEANADGITVRDASEVTGLSVGGVQRTIDNLVKRKYVHKPKGHWAVNDDGRAALEKDTKQQAESATSIFESLSLSDESHESVES